MAKRRKLTDNEFFNQLIQEEERYQGLSRLGKIKENFIFMMKATVITFVLIIVIAYIMNILGYKPTYNEKDRHRIELMLENKELYLDENGTIQKKEMVK
jgi:hypothetical protein